MQAIGYFSRAYFLADSQMGMVKCLGWCFLEESLLTICSSRVGAYLKGGQFEDLLYSSKYGGYLATIAAQIYSKYSDAKHLTGARLAFSLLYTFFLIRANHIHNNIRLQLPEVKNMLRT